MSDLPYEVMSDEELIHEFHKAGIWLNGENPTAYAPRGLSGRTLEAEMIFALQQQRYTQVEMNALAGAIRNQQQRQQFSGMNVAGPLGGALGGLLR